MTWGAAGLGDGNQIGERDHRAGIGTNVVLANILRVRAELLVGLDINTIRTVVEIEIVDVRRSHVDAEGVGDLAERDVKALGFSRSMVTTYCGSFAV